MWNPTLAPAAAATPTAMHATIAMVAMILTLFRLPSEDSFLAMEAKPTPTPANAIAIAYPQVKPNKPLIPKAIAAPKQPKDTPNYTPPIVKRWNR